MNSPIMIGIAVAAILVFALGGIWFGYQFLGWLFSGWDNSPRRKK